MLTSELTVRMLIYNVRGNVCCPLIHDSFLSSRNQMSTVLATMQAFSNFCCSVAQFSYWFVVFDFNFKATIAEIIGNEEAMDLYRHTTELGSHVRNNSPNCENVRYFYCTISSSSRSVDDTLVMHRAIFVWHLEMKTRKRNRNNKLTEIERFDWFIERMQTRVAFGWLSERSGDKTSCSRTFCKSTNTSLWRHTVTRLADRTMPSPY